MRRLLVVIARFTQSMPWHVLGIQQSFHPHLNFKRFPVSSHTLNTTLASSTHTACFSVVVEFAFGVCGVVYGKSWGGVFVGGKLVSYTHRAQRNNLVSHSRG